MAACPLCSERPAKRFCPAKNEKICAFCCGTKREVEIYCPADCVYLRAARDYEAEKTLPDPELAEKSYKFDQGFVYSYAPALDTLGRVVVAERMQSQWLVDTDAIEVYKALSATMKTLSSGLYYESLPEGPIRQSLFHRLKEVLDRMMQPQETQQAALKVSEAIDILDFLTFAGQMNSSTRPKSRRYLDWLTSMAASSPLQQESPSGLIIP